MITRWATWIGSVGVVLLIGTINLSAELSPCTSLSDDNCITDCKCPPLFVCQPLIARCVSLCGNGEIESGENCLNCSADVACPLLSTCDSASRECAPSCGNEICEPLSGEDCLSCADCACDATHYCKPTSLRCESRCGNGLCETSAGESSGGCADCGCGNGLCEPSLGETCSNCADCACSALEYCMGAQCKQRCGNGICDTDTEENCVTCVNDCPTCLGLHCDPSAVQPSALIRASRRGQNPAVGQSAFAPDGAPGSWGQAYDTDVNTANWGTGSPFANLKLRNSSSGNVDGRSGTPATIIAPKSSYFQINDPISPLSEVKSRVSSLDYRYTSFFQVMAIAGPESISGDAAQSYDWTGVAVAGAWMEESVPIALPPGVSPAWTLLTPPDAVKPPQKCDPSPCDTDQTTVRFPPLAPDEVSYGPNPDSKTPYLILQKRQPWTLLKGRLSDPISGQPLLGASIIVVDRQGKFRPIAKLSHGSPYEASEGGFSILVPWAGIAQVFINPHQPVSGIPLTAYDFDPRYGSLMFPNVPLPTDMSKPGISNVKDLGVIRLPNARQTSLSQKGRGRIEGTVRAQELSSTGLKDVILRLRNPNGRVLQAIRTDSTGRYVFTEIPSGKFFIDPVLRRGMLSTPANLIVELKEAAQSLGNDLLLSGVPALVDVQSGTPGTLVLLSSQEWVGLLPPSPRQEEKQLKIYSLSVEESGIARLRPAIGQAYFLTCWVPDAAGHFMRRPALGSFMIKDAKPLQPTDRLEVSCPSN